jgi:N-glycosylase/DNA lyase
VHNLCKHYGSLIGYIGDDPFHDFPTPEALTGSQVESHLRELGFGYRARYISDTARIVASKKPKGWLESLTNPENPAFGGAKPTDLPQATYRVAHEQLLELTGVGPKVADCVCLMGLGWGEAVPVDTHVWQIAQRDYKFGKAKTKTFNKVMYDAVGDHFRELWGKHAGWAYSVLFTADLKTFSNRAVKKEEAKIIEVKEEEKAMVDEVITSRKRRSMTRTTLKGEADHKDVSLLAVTEERPSKKRRSRR